MTKEKITYTDYDGNVRTETCYFNLNEAELTEMQFEKQGGLKSWLEKISEEQDSVEIMKMFKTIILRSYGIKSDDGRRLIKSDEISLAFSQTEAYNQLFIKLISGGDVAMINFIKAILPESFRGATPVKAVEPQVVDIAKKPTEQ